MELKEIDIRRLRTNDGSIEGLPKNPRKISKKKLEQLKKSVQDAPEMLKLRELIAVESDDGYVVICGNQRLEAAKALGMETLPVKVLPADTDPAKLREYAIKDNLPFGEDDWEVLTTDWDVTELEEWGMEVPDVWKDTTEAVEDDFNADAVVECVCQKYDVWQLGRHRLMCGDSTDQNDVAVLMDGKKADLLLTDPPYGVSYGEKNKLLNKLDGGNRIEKEIENDQHSEQETFELWKKVFANAYNATNDCMSYYVFGAQKGDLLLLLLLALKENELASRHGLVWVKNNHVLARTDYNYKHEPITFGWKTNGTHKFYGGFKTTVLEYDKPLKSELHPTMKPIPLLSELINNSTQEGDIVLDVFGGSGSTLIAAEQLNRTCYMMELDPHYCDIIIARWEKLTGQTAVKLS